jgi:hypothetical protein
MVMLFSGLVYAEALNLKGLYIGLSLEEAKKVAPKLTDRCSTTRDLTGYSCYYSSKHHGGNETVANKPVLSWMTIHDGQNVSGLYVTMDSGSFDHIVAALETKWGKPSSKDESMVSNRMGAKFDQVEVSWVKDGVKLRATKRGSKVDEMRITLVSEAALKKFNEDKAKSAADAAKDL